MLAIFQAADVTSISQGTDLFSIGDVYRVSFYEYSATLPVAYQAAAGEKYWLGLLGISNDYYPAFAWSGATGGDDRTIQETLDAGMSVTSTDVRARERAFQLEGVALPEPGSYALIGLGLVGLVVRRAFRIRAGV